jgi:hypothetical protein
MAGVQVSGMSVAMKNVMNSTNQAAAALNRTMSMATKVAEEQDKAVREAMKEATNVRLQPECKSVPAARGAVKNSPRVSPKMN